MNRPIIPPLAADQPKTEVETSSINRVEMKPNDPQRDNMNSAMYNVIAGRQHGNHRDSWEKRFANPDDWHFSFPDEQDKSPAR